MKERKVLTVKDEYWVDVDKDRLVDSINELLDGVEFVKVAHGTYILEPLSDEEV